MTAAYLLLTYTAMLGSLTVLAAAPSIPALWLAAVSVPTGILVVGYITALTSLLIRLDAAGIFVLLAVLLLLMALAAARTIQGMTFGRAVRTVVATMAVVACCIGLHAWSDFSFVLGDTMIQSRLMQDLVQTGWNEYAGAYLSSWSFIYLGYGMVTVATGQTINTLCGNVALVSLLLSAVILLKTFVLQAPNRVKAMLMGTLIFLTVVITAATAVYLYMILYFVSSNVLLAVYSLLATACLISRAIERRDEDWQPVILAIALLGIALSRAEGIVYFSIFAIWMLAGEDRAESSGGRSIIWASCLYLVAALVQVTYVFDGVQGMISPAQFMVFVFAAAAWIPVAILAPRLLGAPMVHSLAELLTALLLIVIVTAAYVSADFAASLSATSQNVLNLALWGTVPFLALSVAALLMAFCGNRRIALFLPQLAMVVSIVLLLSLGRTPYFRDIGDSGHRILGSFIPVFLLALMGALLALAQRSMERTLEPRFS